MNKLIIKLLLIQSQSCRTTELTQLQS